MHDVDSLNEHTQEERRKASLPFKEGSTKSNVKSGSGYEGRRPAPPPPPKPRRSCKMVNQEKISIARIKAIANRRESILSRALVAANGPAKYSDEERQSFVEQRNAINERVKQYAKSLSAEEFPVLNMGEIASCRVEVKMPNGQSVEYAHFKPEYVKLKNKLESDFEAMIDALYLEGLTGKVKEDYKHLLEA